MFFAKKFLLETAKLSYIYTHSNFFLSKPPAFILEIELFFFLFSCLQINNTVLDYTSSAGLLGD